MSCDCCDSKDTIEFDKKELMLIKGIENAIGHAINVNMTNFFKRNLMKDTVDTYTYAFDREHYETIIELQEAKENWKKQVSEDLDKIAKAENGYEATKIYMEIIANLL